MKVSLSFAVLALTATSVAEEWDPLPNKRDVATIQNVIMMASGALKTLDDTVKAFNGQDFNKLAMDSANLKNVLVSGTSQISATTPISANDAITLQSSLSPIQQLGTSLVQDLQSKKKEVQQASLCSIVQQQTQDIGSAAKGLIDATVMKVPASLQQVAGQLTGQFTGQLNDVSLSFAPGNCTNAAGGAASVAGITMTNGTGGGSSGGEGGMSGGEGGMSGMPGMPGMSGSGEGGVKAAASTSVASVFGIVVAGAAAVLLM